MRTTLALFFALTVAACSSETATYSAALEDGEGGTAAETSAPVAAPSTLAAVGGSTSAATTAEPAKACVPGQSVACACPDGATSSQVCAADGQSYGACDCGPAEVVAPAGYSGECVPVGLSPSWCPDSKPLYLNCPAPPYNSCVPASDYGLRPETVGAYCC